MDRLILKNFRVFEGQYSFDIKPITILTGRNNSGKSSMIKGILLLADFLSGKNQTVLQFNNDLAAKHKIDSFKYAHNNKSSKLAFELGYEQTGIIYNFEFVASRELQIGLLSKFSLHGKNLNDELVLAKAGSSFNLRTKLNFLDRLYKSNGRKGNQEELFDLDKELEEINLRIQSSEVQLEIISSKKSAISNKSELIELASTEQRLFNQLKLLRAKRNELMHGEVEEPIIDTSIQVDEDDYLEQKIDRMIGRSIMRYGSMDSTQRFSISEAYRLNRWAIDQLSKGLDLKVFHLGPNRTHQSRLYVNANRTSEINNIINELSLHPIKPGKLADIFLKRWLGKELFDIGESIEVKNVEQIASYLYVRKNGQNYNLVDMGFGSGQILTILIKMANLLNEYGSQSKEGIRFRRSTVLFLIEEPESNLHPRLQSLLADFFIDAIRTSKPYFDLKFIVETHSEYLIRKLQLLTAEGLSASSDSIIYYMDFQNPEGEKFKSISILEDGRLSDSFGEGFYDEGVRQALELTKRRRRAERNG